MSGTRRLQVPEGMIYVPPGSFVTGTSPQQAKALGKQFRDWEDEWFAAEIAGARSEHLGGYYFDKYPVTNSQYRTFVFETGRAMPDHWLGKGADEGKVFYPKAQAEHPVTHVTWDDAVAYCNWAGKRLPSTIEWEKAARGTAGNVWPWGNTWDPERANCAESGTHETTPVDGYKTGKSYYGAYDMSGNVWEWVADKVSSPKELDPESYRMLRGGSWRSPIFYTRCAVKYSADAKTKSDAMGFRCARDA